MVVVGEKTLKRLLRCTISTLMQEEAALNMATSTLLGIPRLEIRTERNGVGSAKRFPVCRPRTDPLPLKASPPRVESNLSMARSRDTTRAIGLLRRIRHREPHLSHSL